MSAELERAIAAAGEASQDAQQLEVMRAVLIAQAVQQGLQAVQSPACQHHGPPPRQSANAGKWAAIAVAGSVCAISLALSAIAVAVGAVAVTCCLLVLRGLWADFQKNR